MLLPQTMPWVWAQQKPRHCQHLPESSAVLVTERDGHLSPRWQVRWRPKSLECPVHCCQRSALRAQIWAMFWRPGTDKQTQGNPAWSTPQPHRVEWDAHRGAWLKCRPVRCRIQDRVNLRSHPRGSAGSWSFPHIGPIGGANRNPSEGATEPSWHQHGASKQTVSLKLLTHCSVAFTLN